MAGFAWSGLRGLLLGLVLAFAAEPAAAGVYIVNSGVDLPDAFPPDGRCDTTGIPAIPAAGFPGVPYSGVCTLRAAIQTTNVIPGAHEIPIRNSLIIAVLAPLPPMNNPVTISPITLSTAPQATIQFVGAGPSGDALTFAGGRSQAQLLSIIGFKDGAAIRLQGSLGNRIVGNLLGVNWGGAVVPNRDGVYIDNSRANDIGDAQPRRRNIISGNLQEGVYVTGANSRGNHIAGNYIGLDPTGQAAMGNGRVGVWLNGAFDNTVGGATAPHGNLIVANGHGGVLVSGGGQNRVHSNFIGLTPNPVANLGNALFGVYVHASPDNEVGGPTVAAAGTTTTAALGASTTTIVGRAPKPNAGVPPGNVISRNDGPGVVIDGTASTGNRVEGNIIGLAQNGASAQPNTGDGVAIAGAPSNAVGGLAAGAGNLIGSNQRVGVRVSGAQAAGNRVLANWIGVDATGRQARGNGTIGVYVLDAPNTQIGGARDAERNLISGNGTTGPYSGVRIMGQTASGNRVEGNIIGMDERGVVPIANGGNGVTIEDAPDNTVGGLNPTTGTSFPRNLISGNKLSGVMIKGAPARGNKVAGNYIGPDATGAPPPPGSLAFPLQPAGVWINGAPDNLVGDPTAAGRNVISNNDQGVMISGVEGRRNKVLANYIGVDQSGQEADPNGQAGVVILDGADNEIGGPTPTAGAAPGNIVSANLATHRGGALQVQGATASGNKLRGNLVGLAADGTTPLGNKFDGVLIALGAHDNEVGGPKVEDGNVIAHNEHVGVAVVDGTSATSSVGNAILSNRIFKNTELGIDLGRDGPTAPAVRVKAGPLPVALNGPNLWQASPKLHLVKGGWALLDAKPNTDHRIQVFFTDEGDPDGYGQGETLARSANPPFETVRTDAEGFAKLKLPRPPAGKVLTATATDDAGNTSEFARLACDAAPADAQLTSSIDWSMTTQAATWNHTLGGSTPVQVVKFDRGGFLVMKVRVGKTASDVPEKAFIRITMLNQAPDAPVAEAQIYGEAQPLGPGGEATVGVNMNNVLAALGAPLNKNFLKARLHVCYRGRTTQADAETTDPVHVVRDKVIVFLPGVLGSTIRVRVTPTPPLPPYTEWAYPVASPLYAGAPLLEMTAQGRPVNPAAQLKLFDSYYAVWVGSITAVPLRKIYDIDTAVTDARGLVPLPEVTLGGQPMAYYKVFPWAYDWRLHLDEDVTALRSGQPPALTGYDTPPSIDHILSQWAPGEFGPAEARLLDTRKVALAGHSTGGLIMRTALSDPAHAGFFGQKVDRAYFINVPFYGAPKAYYAYFTGKMLETFIEPALLQRLGPNMPIIYDLAPAVGYSDYRNRNRVAEGVDAAGAPVTGVRRASGDTRLFMPPLIQTAGAQPWNQALADAADDLHTRMLGAPPTIGWRNTTVFWTEAKSSGSTAALTTPGPVQVFSASVGKKDTAGDETVPTASQRGDFPEKVQVERRGYVHQDAANNPQVWKTILAELNVPDIKDFSGFGPLVAQVNGAGNRCVPRGEIYGLAEMDRLAASWSYKKFPFRRSPLSFSNPIAQGFDEAYCDGIYVKELAETGFECHGTFIVGEAKGGYRGERLEQVMGYGYYYRQGTLEWAGNAAAYVRAHSSHRPQLQKARIYTDLLTVGSLARIETFHAECGAPPPGTPPQATETRYFRTDAYPR